MLTEWEAISKGEGADLMSARGGFIALIRHARACPGHPRLFDAAEKKEGVDGRTKSGHDKK
jgi:hypothetical protein